MSRSDIKWITLCENKKCLPLHPVPSIKAPKMSPKRAKQTLLAALQLKLKPKLKLKLKRQNRNRKEFLVFGFSKSLFSWLIMSKVAIN